jgi:hypothetical protein
VELLAPAARRRENTAIVRSIIALVVALGIALGSYYFYFRRVQPQGAGTVPTQAISLTGVQTDLLAIAQAERSYFAQHGSYASLGELTSSGTLTMPRTGRGGYSYSVETSAEGFNITARYSTQPNDASGLRYPTFTVDQTMQVQQTD